MSLWMLWESKELRPITIYRFSDLIAGTGIEYGAKDVRLHCRALNLGEGGGGMLRWNSSGDVIW